MPFTPTMTLVLLTGGTTTTFDLLNRSQGFAVRMGADGDFGIVPEDGSARVMSLPIITYGSTAVVHATRLSSLRRALAETRAARVVDGGRIGELKIKMDTASTETIYDVISGTLEEHEDLSYQRRIGYLPATLRLSVEHYGRGAESDLLSAASLALRHQPAYLYVFDASAGTFGENTAGVVDGDIFNRTAFVTSPTTITPAAGDILYFGFSAAVDRLILGIRTARVATGVTAVWEYSDGAGVWTTLTTTSDFRSGAASTEWDTVAEVGSVDFTAPGGWEADTVNGLSAFWIRWRITAVSTFTTNPIRLGPLRSHLGVGYIAPAAVAGDAPASARVHLVNPTANAYGRVVAGFAAGLRSAVAPPFVIPLAHASGTDAIIPTGDSTLARAADTETVIGQRVTATLVAALSDYALQLDGVNDVITTGTLGSTSTKLSRLGQSSFFVEVGFRTGATVPDEPTPVLCQWNASGNARSWWLGTDQSQPGIIWAAGTVGTAAARQRAHGGTVLQPLTRYILTFEYDKPRRLARVYLDCQAEKEKTVKANRIYPGATGVTTAVKSGKSVNFATTDSRAGDEAEVYAPYAMEWVWIVAGKRIKEFFKDVGAEESYPYPDGDPAGTVGQGSRSEFAANASTVLYWGMDGSSASTADGNVPDTSAGPINGTLEADGGVNIAPNSVAIAGFFQAGATSLGRVLGVPLPRSFANEHAGPYRVFLAARPASALASIYDIEWAVQFGAGDVTLGFNEAARHYPSVASPTGYYLVDLGTVHFPYRPYADLKAVLFARHPYTATGTAIAQHLDCLYFVPAWPWSGDYETFRSTWASGNGIAQNEGIAWDGLGPRPLVYQTTTTGTTDPKPNPYARPAGGALRLMPALAQWLYAIPLRGDTTNILERRIADTLTATVRAAPRSEGLI